MKLGKTATPAGRFAPSPSGELHVGNLRTAVVAWLFARTTGRAFYIRMEDLDRAVPGADRQQLADLGALGMDWDPPVVHQSRRLPEYQAVIDNLRAQGRTFECFCTRREIQEAPSAPHGPPGAYPGTCRNLTDAERAERRSSGRPAAIRLRADVAEFTVTDIRHGDYTGTVDDFVIQRNDGTPAYNLAVVVDDAIQGIDQVVRGDDLLLSAPRQAYLATLLGYRPPHYAHVPMVVNHKQIRLSKRDGAVTLAELADRGVSPQRVLQHIAASLRLANAEEAVDLPALADRFVSQRLPDRPWVLTDDEWHQD